MAITNQDRVGKAMDLLRTGLAPFVEREFKNQHQAQAPAVARRYFGDDRTVGKKPVTEWDVAALLKLVNDRTFESIEAPTLIFRSRDDQVIDPRAVEAAFSHLTAVRKELVTITDAGDPSNHVLAGEILSPGTTARVVDRIAAFLK